MNHLSDKVVETCKRKLLETKMDLLNRAKDAERGLREMVDKATGDEGDQSMQAIAEGEMLSNQERIRYQLREIEAALFRIQNGTYGICEETEEPIESDRLLAIPWTRLSIEGAEVREAVEKRFAR